MEPIRVGATIPMFVLRRVSLEHRSPATEEEPLTTLVATLVLVGPGRHNVVKNRFESESVGP